LAVYTEKSNVGEKLEVNNARDYHSCCPALKKKKSRKRSTSAKKKKRKQFEGD
jgi:hypothetical protein